MTFALGVFVASLDGRRPECPGQVQSEVRREQSQWEVMLSFLNRDLRKLDRQSKDAFRDAVDSVTGGIDPELTPTLIPRVFRLVSNTTGQHHYLLVEEANSMITPGTSFLRIVVFDFDGRVLNAKTASSYRELFRRVHVRKVANVPGDVLIVETTYEPYAGAQTRQFYALVENEIRLVYVQLNGRFDPTGHGIVARMQRSVEDWERALNSDDFVESMSALLWLNANHWTGAPMYYDEREAEKAENLLARKDVRSRLRKLKQSRDPWMKNATRSLLDTL